MRRISNWRNAEVCRWPPSTKSCARQLAASFPLLLYPLIESEATFRVRALLSTKSNPAFSVIGLGGRRSPEVTLKPNPCDAPVAPDSALSSAQNRCDFSSGKSRENPEFRDLMQPRIRGAQPLERLINGDEIR